VSRSARGRRVTGPEVYELLGVPRGKKEQIDEKVVTIARAIGELPEAWREAVRRVVAELAAETNEESGEPGEEEILKRIAAKYSQMVG
jgi:hypothetical protein